MTKNSRSYALLFMATIAGLLVLVAGINIVVDPYGLFGQARIDGFNADKTKMDYGRAVKSIEICRDDYEMLLVGSSRVLFGFDRRSTALAGYRMYNAGLAALTLEELGAILKHAVGCRAPSRIVIGLDFEAFVVDRDVGKDFSRSAFAGQGDIETLIGLLFSHSTLKDSIGTVMDNLAGTAPLFQGHGFFDNLVPLAVVPERIEINLRKLANWFYNAAPRGYDRDNMAVMNAVMEGLGDEVKQVDIFIPPVHAMRMEMYLRLGYSSDYEAWLRDLADFVATMNRKNHGKFEVRLWNFGGFNSITRTPSAVVADVLNPWYFEDTHFTAKTGELILAQVMGVATENMPDDFGNLVTPHKVDEEIAKMHEKRRFYVESRPREIELLEDIERKMATIR